MTLRLLVDEPVNGFIARALADAYDIVFAVHIGLSGQPDTEVSRRAVELDRLVLTEDRNFTRYILEQTAPHPGIIVLELEGLPLDMRIARVKEALASEAAHAFAGQATIIRPQRVRRRPL